MFNSMRISMSHSAYRSVRDQHFATVCFNGMLNPVIPYAIRGALWYQGESICWGNARPQFIWTSAKDDDSRLAVAVGRRRFPVLSGATAGAGQAHLQQGDTLVVWRLDRLGRSMHQLVELVEELRNRDIGFRSVSDGFIDTTSASGELIFHIFSALLYLNVA